MAKAQRHLNRFLEDTQLLELELPGKPLVEICGRNRILIEGHCGIREYGTRQICVAVRGGWIVIGGCDMELRCMSRHRLVITGVIQSVTLQGSDKS